MKKNFAVLLVAIACAATAWGAGGPTAPRTERVEFPKGASSTTIKGSLKGGQDVDYMVRAAAGQTLEVRLQGTNGQNHFNILPPGSANAAMFNSGVTGDATWKGVLPDDGHYAIRVYLGRAAARRSESSQYTLTVAVTGKPLPALSASRDAKFAGTAYHAVARVNCAIPYQPAITSCDAGVVRRGNDGTATLSASDGKQWKRSILFMKGKPVAADAMDRISSTRLGDVTTVKLGEDERYEIPDALLAGG